MTEYPTTFALVNEWTGLTVEEVTAPAGSYKFGQDVDFDGQLWTVVKLVHPSSHYTQVFLRLVK